MTRFLAFTEGQRSILEPDLQSKEQLCLFLPKPNYSVLQLQQRLLPGPSPFDTWLLVLCCSSLYGCLCHSISERSRHQLVYAQIA